MTDTPRNAIESAMDESPAEETAVELTSEDAKATQTPEVSEEQLKAEPEEQTKEEKFADEVDLSGMNPEQLKATYDNWQKAYTLKRQKETAELKQIREERETLARELESLKQTPQTQEQPQNSAQEVLSKFKSGQLTPEQYASEMIRVAQEEARKVAEEQYTSQQEKATQEAEQSYQETALQEFQNSDPRLNDNDPTFDSDLRDTIQSKMADALDVYMSEHGTAKGFKAGETAKKFIEEHDAKINEIVKTRTQKSVQAAKMRDAKAIKNEVRGTTSDSVSTDGNSIRDVLMDAVNVG